MKDGVGLISTAIDNITTEYTQLLKNLETKTTGKFPIYTPPPPPKWKPAPPPHAPPDVSAEADGAGADARARDMRGPDMKFPRCPDDALEDTTRQSPGV